MEIDDFGVAVPAARPARRSSLRSLLLSELPRFDSLAETAIDPFWLLDEHAGNQLTDKLMEKLLHVMIHSDSHEPALALAARRAMQRTRPPLLVNVMSINSTQMAQKGGPLFEVIDHAMYFMAWHNTYLTLGVLSVATHVILKPQLAALVPLLLLLHIYLVPSYLKLYPPEESLEPYAGPPLGKFVPPKPAVQNSPDFIMNFTDMQNHQVSYVRLYDFLVDWGQHYLLFEDEALSSVVYLTVVVVPFIAMVLLPRLAHLVWFIPFKSFLLGYMWLSVGAFHPSVKQRILDFVGTEEARLLRTLRLFHIEEALMRLMVDETPTIPEREVEVFEIQHKNPTWEPLGYTSTLYALSSMERKEPLRFVDIDNVLPPQRYDFCQRGWKIDYSTEWVGQSCISDVVVVDHDTKWVYDVNHVYRRRRWTRRCYRVE